VRDLTTLKGIGEYVRGEVAEAINHSLEKRGEVSPLGVVLAMRNGREDLDEPLPAIFGGFNIEPAQILAVLRNKARALKGVGVLHVEAEGARVLFRLEHKTLGDLEWRAPITRDKATKVLGEFAGPLAVDPDDLTRFLPSRYMN